MTLPWNNSALVAACTTLIVLMVVAACATGPQVELDKLNDQIGFIVVGETTRQAVVDEFGEPTSSYENGGIVVYVFRRVENGPLPRTPLPPEGYGPQLVLEFDGEDTVVRYVTLVPP